MTYLVAYELKLFAPVTVNGEDMLGYLDTAATQVTISSRLAKNLPRKGKMKVRSAFGEKEFETASVDVEFLGQKYQSVQARVHGDETHCRFVRK